MGVQALIRSGVGGRVPGLLRRLVVLALIGTAFAAVFATSAFAAEEFELRPVKDSNQTVHVGHYVDHTVRKINTVYYTINQVYPELTFHLEESGQLSFDAYGVGWATATAIYDCYWKACPSQEYAWLPNPAWRYYWVAYRGRLWLGWQWE